MNNTIIEQMDKLSQNLFDMTEMDFDLRDRISDFRDQLKDILVKFEKVDKQKIKEEYECHKQIALNLVGKTFKNLCAGYADFLFRVVEGYEEEKDGVKQVCISYSVYRIYEYGALEIHTYTNPVVTLREEQGILNDNIDYYLGDYKECEFEEFQSILNEALENKKV